MSTIGFLSSMNPTELLKLRVILEILDIGKACFCSMCLEI